jgi:hypothetical protein
MSPKRRRPRPSHRRRRSTPAASRKRSTPAAADPLVAAMRAKQAIAQRAFYGPATFDELVGPWEACIEHQLRVERDQSSASDFLQRLRASDDIRQLAQRIGGRAHCIIALCYCLSASTARARPRSDAQQKTAGRLAVQRFRERTRRSEVSGEAPVPSMPAWYREWRGLDPGRPRTSQDEALRARRLFETILSQVLGKLLRLREPRWKWVVRLRHEFSTGGRPLSQAQLKREEALTRRRVRAARHQLRGHSLAMQDWAAELVQRVAGVVVGRRAARGVRLL